MTRTGISGHVEHVLANFTKEHGHVREIASYAERLSLKRCFHSTIVVDTLNRVLAGGDENSSIDMGKFIRVVSSLQELTGAPNPFEDCWPRNTGFFA